ncbi:hypothetical protein GCM10012275_18750 [Longimycelium tulufanense]|uniref:N-acetylmuramoyl-L-alanine amidase n=1 Tax=Longimycelium tulufanense TaxID=907463 RepID=A0A8J3C9Z6_9PSEU|nr:peptidoglycan recognition protein [Longimycelium tulufanense]GGM47943.1 hypothetical protein GCM10012275_18750 [Longimycelium tulufanense]
MRPMFVVLRVLAAVLLLTTASAAHAPGRVDRSVSPLRTLDVGLVERNGAEVGDGRQFSMVGLRWPGQRPPGLRIRAGSPGQGWTRWFEIEPDEGHPASEPVWTGSATRLQVRADMAVSGRLSAVLIDPGRLLRDVSPRKNDAGVITREEWGADESLMCWEPEYADNVYAATVHHSAGTNDYSPEEAPQLVRAIYLYHVQALGWCDIGYHALVDRYGRVYEGRFGGLDTAVWGAHALNFNEGTTGVSLIGDHRGTPPTPAALEALASFLAWKFPIHGVDPRGTVGLPPRFPQLTLHTVFAHRDVNPTECPGDGGYRHLHWLRHRIAELMPG